MEWIIKYWIKWAIVSYIVIAIGLALAPKSHGAFGIGSGWVETGGNPVFPPSSSGQSPSGPGGWRWMMWPLMF